MNRPRRIVSIVGTRPNFMKIAPVAGLLSGRDDVAHSLVHTGQHYDEAMSQIFLEQLGVGAPDHLLEVGSGSHAVQTARVMERLEPLLVEFSPDLVLVPGDVNSTAAAALVATKLGLRVGHVEAGLRSFDRTMPEEVNRVVTDAISDLLFVHSPEAVDNLLAEGAPPDAIFDVGNTMIDTLVAMLPQIRAAGVPDQLGLPDRGYLLVTLHRPALTDGSLLADAVEELRRLADDLPVVFPVHPRARGRIEAQRLETGGIRLIDPLGYIEFMSLVHSAAAVLTDSGGVQEETTYLGIPCFTLRDNTERPVTVTEGTNILLGLCPARIAELPELLASASAARRPAAMRGWDGSAAQRIVDVLCAAELPRRGGQSASIPVAPAGLPHSDPRQRLRSASAG